jgi:uncharacterized protein YlzI (FlbEa/FlbD family)
LAFHYFTKLRSSDIVDKAPETDLTLTLSNGETITIKAGETEGSVSFDPRADDLYKQGEQEIAISITGSTGGNYENLDTGATIDYKVNDDSDKTTVSLSIDSADVLEGTQVTVTATVDNAPETDLTLTLSNGETITIKDGE